MMQNIFKKTFSWGMAHKAVSVIVIILVLIVGYFGYKSVFAVKTTTQYVIGSVTKGDLVITVNGTGQVAAENQVDLKPSGTTQAASTITEVDVKQGDTVAKDQLIAVVNNASAQTSLTQAKANVESAQASYDKTTGGATPQSLAVSKQSVSTAQLSLSTSARNAYLQIQDAFLNKISGLFQNNTSANPTLTITTDSSQGALDINNARVDMTNRLSGWNALLSASSTTSDSAISKISDDITAAQSLINTLSSAVNRLNPFNSGMTQDAINADVAAVNSAATEINTAESSYNSAIQSYKTAVDQLAVTETPSTSQDIEISKAQLDNAEAALQSAQTTYDQSFLRAPFDGVVAAVNVSPGDVVDTATVVATIITTGQIAKISLNEVDAANVKIGDPAVITFSALPDVTATGTVSQIDTIGTVTQGVVSYNAKIAFDAADSGVKPGMSTSADISVGKDSGVLLVPNSAVSTVGSNSTVQMLDNVSGVKDGATISTNIAPRLVQVEVGDSDNTNTVITSGLTEGQLIVVHTVTGTTTKASGGLFSAPGGN
ncbi:MAG: efflux RND transporter periplasmic adaptor subunit [Candidatus Pacebacteria bacterium]|nr:efflux RND transporter periplasmic adaptor subunit [Candidatus Paceibacterota bacterium]